MKILSIEVVNYKKIEALYLEPNGQALKVAGTTGQGKTTAISALWEAMETVGDPIRHQGNEPGATAALRLILGGDSDGKFLAERTYTAGGTKIVIRSEDGKKKITAKEFKSWVSSLAANPHKIMDMGPQEQTAALLRAAVMPKGFDLSATDVARAAAHEAREDARKDVTRLGQEVGIRPREVARVDTKKTLSLLQEMTSDKATAEASESSRAAQLRNMDQEIADTRARLAALEKDREVVRDIRQELVDWIAENVHPEKIVELQTQLERAEETNLEAQEYETWVEKNEKLETAKAVFHAKDQEVKALEEQKRDALSKVKWPINGLSIDNGEISYRGTPLSQCGTSERILVCGALAANEIEKSRLRVVRLDGIESMSSEDFATLEKLFEDRDIQVLASRVTRGDLEDGELLIHDGNVVEVEND